jgi:hypothetical protein
MECGNKNKYTFLHALQASCKDQILYFKIKNLTWSDRTDVFLHSKSGHLGFEPEMPFYHSP